MGFLPMAMALAPLLMRAAPVAARAAASPTAQRILGSSAVQGAARSTPVQKGRQLMSQATEKSKTMASKGVMEAQRRAPGMTSRALQGYNWTRANPQHAADLAGYGGLAMLLMGGGDQSQPQPQPQPQMDPRMQQLMMQQQMMQRQRQMQGGY